MNPPQDRPSFFWGWLERLKQKVREPVMRKAIVHVHEREPPKPDPAFLNGRMAEEANNWLSRLMEHMSDEDQPIHEVTIGFSVHHYGINAFIGSGKYMQPVRFHTPFDDVPTSSLEDAHLPYLRSVLINRGKFETYVKKERDVLKKGQSILFALYKIHAGRYLANQADVTAFIPVDDPGVMIRLMMHPQFLQHRIKGSMPSIPPSSSSR